MSLVCSVTGEVPEEPVFSTKTNFIYEKRLILKHLSATGCCPISGARLDPGELIEIKKNPTIKPRPLSASSIPGLLSCLQSEWDSLMTETFTLKTHLEQVRKQLAHALYQQDAATRVIARLLKEKDAAQQQLQQVLLQLQRSETAAGEEADTESGISETLLQEMQALAKQLLSGRKKRKVTSFFDPPSICNSLKSVLQLPLHSASSRGVLRVFTDVNPTRLAAVFSQEGGGPPAPKSGKVISVSSGADGAVVFFDLYRTRQLEKIQAHAKPCRDLQLHASEPVIVTASDDKTCKIWRGSLDFSSNYACVATLRKQRGEVTSLALHPLGNYFAAVSADKSWAFASLDEGRYLRIFRNMCQYLSVGFHPDGMILGAGGADGQVYIWDVRAQEQRAALQGHSGGINKLDFSENGYYLATASADGTVRLWDLRKSASFQTLQVGDEGSAAMAARFDHSGLFVAAGNSSGTLHLFNFEGRASAVPVACLQDHTDAVMDVAFVEGQDMILSASMDKTVQVWEPTKD